MVHRPTLASLLLLSLLVVGCGGSGDDDGPTNTPTTNVFAGRYNARFNNVNDGSLIRSSSFVISSTGDVQGSFGGETQDGVLTGTMSAAGRFDATAVYGPQSSFPNLVIDLLGDVAPTSTGFSGRVTFTGGEAPIPVDVVATRVFDL